MLMALNIKQISNLSDAYKNALVKEIDGQDYKTIDLEKTIKIGYMCEPKAMILPIYLKIDGEYKKFQIGKTRIFEVSDVEISGVRIPNGIKFTFDYICDN